MGPSLSNSLTHSNTLLKQVMQVMQVMQDVQDMQADNANRAFRGNVAMQVAQPGGTLSHWDNCN